MNVPLLTLADHSAPHQDTRRSETSLQSVSVVIYIDADNQSPQCAKPLANLLQTDLGLQVTRIVLAGNNHGKEIENWRDALATELPNVEVVALQVSSRKQSADAALIMEIGANLERHLHDRDRVVIVSRDDFLVGAAEHAKTKGCRVLVAYAHSEIPAVRSTWLTTLVLPAVSKPTGQTLPAADKSVKTSSVPVKTVDVLTAVIAELRVMCAGQPGGGYTANEVGQALCKLGFDTKEKRTQFLKAIPGLQERGTGADKVLVF